MTLIQLVGIKQVSLLKHNLVEDEVWKIYMHTLQGKNYTRQTRVPETFLLTGVNSATMKATRYVLMLTVVFSNSSCTRPLRNGMVLA